MPDPTPAPAPLRPGDLILVRAIAWWDSGQIQRAASGIILAALPSLYDLATGKDPLTWRGLVSALVMGLFAWMGLSRAKSPDVATGSVRLDQKGVASRVDAQALSDIQRSTPTITVPKVGG